MHESESSSPVSTPKSNVLPFRPVSKLVLNRRKAEERSGASAKSPAGIQVAQTTQQVAAAAARALSARNATSTSETKGDRETPRA